LLTDENIDIIAKETLQMSKGESNRPFLKRLNGDLRKVETALENLAIALKKGEEVDFIIPRISEKMNETEVDC